MSLLYIKKIISKSDLRVYTKFIRKSLDIETKSREIVKNIRKNEIYKNAENVLIFYPLKYEINLLELLDDKKNFYLPKVNGNNMFICPFNKGDELIKSDFNVLEPCSNPVDANILNLILVPALAVDKNKFRLGYGGGFYDRFLAEYNNIYTIIPIAKELFIEELPAEGFDKRVNEIITD